MFRLTSATSSSLMNSASCKIATTAFLATASAAASKLQSAARFISSTPTRRNKQQNQQQEQQEQETNTEETTSSSSSTQTEASSEQQTSPRASRSSPRKDAGTFIANLPPGIEVYLGCVFLIGGWWYWLEASARRIDRQCEALCSSQSNRTKQLTEVVNATEQRWHADVKGKEATITKIQRDNIKLAETLDRVSNYLRQCQTPNQVSSK